MSYDGPPILRNETPGVRDLRRLLIGIGVVVALIGAWHLDRALAVFTAGLLVVYLGKRR